MNREPPLDLANYAEEILAAYQERSKWDFLTFVRGLKIDGGNGPAPFSEAMADFQLETFSALAPALKAIKYGKEQPPTQRFWIERTKKASKDTDVACCVLWLIAFAVRPMLIQVVAGDKDQAAIIRDRIEALLFYNPWLNDRVAITREGLANKETPSAKCKVEATDDKGGAHGGTPSLLILNELTHVAKWNVMDTHMTNADGVPWSVVIVATNAGYKGTKAEVWKKTAQGKGNWSAHIFTGTSPWHNKELIQGSRDRLPGEEYSRLFEGRWISGKGDALSEDLINNIFPSEARPHTGRREGWEYIGGLDLGTKHDHSAVAILGVNTTERRIELARFHRFKPSVLQGGVLKVNLREVREATRALAKTFNVGWFGFDPSQAELMAQDLIMDQVPMIEVNFGARNQQLFAETLLQAAQSGQFTCYDDGEGSVRRDFAKFDLTKKSYGYRLEAVSDEYGHADVGVAIIVALPRAVGMLGGVGGGRWTGSEVLALEDGERPLTPEEEAAMDPRLKDLYDMYDPYNRE